MVLPFIVIFDIDQTLIGNMKYCVHEYTILQMIYKNCIVKNKSFPTKCTERGVIDIQEDLHTCLLRPNVKDFITYCEKRFKKQLEVFFYTNSGYTWANTVLVPQIEKALKFKANRPIFTYENSIEWTKTIANIAPLIKKTLIKKYPLLAKETNLQKVFNERMIFIDDIKENVHDYVNRQIVCPEYNYTPYYDVHEKLIKNYNVPEKAFDDTELLNYMKYNELPIYNTNGSIYQQNKECVLLHKIYKAKMCEVYNASLKKDTFFLDMITAFEKIDVFTDKEIAKINKSIQL